ncbi:MAG: HAD family hydrolase [Syntrophomonadaceae bacterium]|nr:HAD family hydrolase [Syntrophomonadaceae bacterium]
MLKAITFDFWDTLYKAPRMQELGDLRVASLQHILQQMGHALNSDSIRTAVLAASRFALQYQRDHGLDITARGQLDCILQYLQVDLDREAWTKVYEAYTTQLRTHPPEMNDGVSATLPLLAEKYKLGVICNSGTSPGSILREFMKKDGILPCFEFLVFSDEVGWAKPNPKIFQYALDNLKVKNYEAAHVGNDSSTDVFGAKNAGMKAIWLAPLLDERCMDCDYKINSISELVALFAT